MTGHRLAEARSLAYHAEIAARLRRDPAVIEAARARVRAWLERDPSPAHYAREWAKVLAGTPESIAEFLIDEGDRASELRQSTPFAGVLSPRERWNIWRAIAKAVAGRERDRAFIREVARHGMVDERTAQERLAVTALDPETRRRVEATLATGFTASGN